MRSVQQSEAQQLQRCTAAVEGCRKDLADLRAQVKAANAHREKCTELLGAATEAVVALEDMLYDPDIDLARERALQQLSARVQYELDKVRYGAGQTPGTSPPVMFRSTDLFPCTLTPLHRGRTPAAACGRLPPFAAQPDPSCQPWAVGYKPHPSVGLACVPQGEAVVRVYGSMSGVQKLVSKVCSPGTPLKFDEVIRELTGLAKQARLQRAPPPPLAPRLGTLASAALGSGTPPSAAAALSPTASGLAAASGPAPSAGLGSAPPGSASSQPSEPHPMTADGSQPQAQGPSSGGAVAYMMGDRQVPEEAMQPKKVRKGGSRQAITSLVHVPPREPGQLGYLWYYLSK
jgi:hypothetical protein